MNKKGNVYAMKARRVYVTFLCKTFALNTYSAFSSPYNPGEKCPSRSVILSPCHRSLKAIQKKAQIFPL